MLVEERIYLVKAAVSSFTRAVANRLGSALVRGISGSLKRGR